MTKQLLGASIAIFLLAATVGAQIHSPYVFPATTAPASPDLAPNSTGNPGGETAARDLSSGARWPDSSAAPEPAPPPQGVYGVVPKSEGEVFVGYTFFRFYEIPGAEANTNGAAISGVYYFKPRLAADAEFLGAFGTVAGSSSQFFMGSIGPRLRLPSRGSFELWGHALAGFSSLSPKTPYGGTTAFAYEVGGGVDVNMRRGRWAYRLQGDAVGTRFFGTYQISPKVSAGIVYKF